MADDNEHLITPVQSRAGRALIDWSQQQLANAAGLSSIYVRKFEKGERSPSTDALKAIQKALEKVGVEFIPENGGGAGVRLAKRMKVRKK